MVFCALLLLLVLLVLVHLPERVDLPYLGHDELFSPYGLAGLAAGALVLVLVLLLLVWRCFILPAERLVNYIVWRSRDTTADLDPLAGRIESGWLAIVAEMFENRDSLAIELRSARKDRAETAGLQKQIDRLRACNRDLTGKIQRKRHRLMKAENAYRKTAETLRQLRQHLNERVRARTAERARAGGTVRHPGPVRDPFSGALCAHLREGAKRIAGFIDRLAATRLDGQQRQIIRQARSKNDALCRLLDDAMDYARLEAGDIVLQAADFFPQQIAAGVVEQAVAELDGKPVELRCHFEKQVPSRVNGDPVRFKQVLTHLVNNAVRFSEAGEIVLSADVADQTSTRIKLRVAVRSTGGGFPELDPARMDAPFYQAGGPETGPPVDAGLGLAICRHLARLMMGEVRVKSPKGQGARFYFSAWFGRVAAD